MTLLRSAMRNISILAVAQLVMWIAALAFTLAQARYLGPARFGALSVAISYAAFVSIVVDFGLGTQLSRMVAQGHARPSEALFATMLLRAGLWLLTLPPLALATLAFDYDPELRAAIFILALSMLFVEIGKAIASYLQGREQFLAPSLAQVAHRLVAAAIGTAVLIVHPDLVSLAGAFVIAGLASIAVVVAGARHDLPRPAPVDVRAALELLRRTAPLAVFSIATAFYWSVDMILLERLAPHEHVGFYAAAYRLFSVATIPATLIAGVALYPVLARLAVGSRDELRTVIEKSLTFLVLAGTALALTFGLLADGIVRLLYPDQYAPAASALRLLAPALLFIHVNWIFASSLLGLHAERRLLVIAIGAAVLNPLANIVAIPLLRENGAALVTSCTELVLLVCLARAMPRDLVVTGTTRVAAKALAAAAITAIAIVPVRDASVFLTAPLTLALFGTLIFAMQTVSRGDLRALRALMRPAEIRS